MHKEYFQYITTKYRHDGRVVVIYSALLWIATGLVGIIRQIIEIIVCQNGKAKYFINNSICRKIITLLLTDLQLKPVKSCLPFLIE